MNPKSEIRNPKFPSVAVIGPGKVGLALTAALVKARWPVAAVGGRSAAHARKALKKTFPNGQPDVSPLSAADAASKADIILLAVPDDKIEPLCRELSSGGAFRRGAVVAHCSGALSSEVLSSARRRASCQIASIHPLQTFPTVDAALEKLPGSFFFIEGQDRAVRMLSRLAGALGGKAVKIDSSAKSLYHAAACIASNYLVTLMDLAVSTEGLAGIPPRRAIEALEPLVRATMENVFTLGPAKALTGPIARGDAETVKKHMHALATAGSRELLEAYLMMGLATIELALRKGTLKPRQAGIIRKILTSGAACG